MFFKLEREGDHYTLWRTAGIPEPVRREHLSLVRSKGNSTCGSFKGQVNKKRMCGSLRHCRISSSRRSGLRIPRNVPVNEMLVHLVAPDQSTDQAGPFPSQRKYGG